ncbi:hypothetical protein K435DRAFT_335427 [Dendrothele bispora CBS 962.96]|uniref:Uncharacterized protein n=1 Tax=Dendrothele bispora (strain CBS 962.96) TaxID=1314807 RepID=A0A4S8LG35_DENBC|nr:hypothetical protein K435DRAFT_335427 [Dendrothele bispora CBS 962.96]
MQRKYRVNNDGSPKARGCFDTSHPRSANEIARDRARSGSTSLPSYIYSHSALLDIFPPLSLSAPQVFPFPSSLAVDHVSPPSSLRQRHPYARHSSHPSHPHKRRLCLYPSSSKWHCPCLTHSCTPQRRHASSLHDPETQYRKRTDVAPDRKSGGADG